MNSVIVVGENPTECALIAAQLREEEPCVVETASGMEDALARLTVRAALVVLDLANQGIDEEQWARFRRALRGARLLLLASRADGARLDHWFDRAHVMFRPFTVGDVVAHARRLLKEKQTNG